MHSGSTTSSSSHPSLLYRFYQRCLDVCGIEISSARFPEERDRVQAGIVFAFQLAYVITWATYVLLYSVLGCYLSASFCAFIGIAPSLVGIWAFRRTSSYKIPGILSNVGSATALCFITSTTGGATSAVLPWMLAVLVGSFLQLGKRGGIGLTVYIVLLYIGIGVWGVLGFTEPYELPFAHDSALFLAFNIYNFAFSAIIAAVIINIFVAHIEQGYHFQRESEYQSRLAEEMKSRMIQSERMASIGTLAAGVAHEINNPMAIIYAYMELLTRKLRDGATKADLPKILEKMQVPLQRITCIIQSLMIYAKPDSGNIEAIDLGRAISDALVFLDPVIRREEISLSLPPLDSLPRVTANAARLQQVLINVGTNSCEALAGRPIPREMGIDVSSSEGWVQLTLWDRGPGIPAEILSKVFDPFFTTKPIGNGTGLGLSVSRSIIESFGGTMEIESSQPSGCRAIIRLRQTS
jgi:signal transduction histidine kinase